ncbi:MAG: FprA family A-type flavoprotein [Deltaproteobacteria bacterium]|nr:FprA family A-type flavoprotein [Deltaproteobacteria bacterium]MBW2071096.1 FprA family A-type flavoprotein [Deltaproteobacteria bacterium]
MNAPYKAIKVSDHVYWVGAIDWGIRDFHGYATYRGTTYNAFLVTADKLTLIDTVKRPFQEELLSRIRSVVDPRDIAYLVSNHAEMDHSGSLVGVLEAIQPEKVFASVMGAKALKDHFHLDQEIVPVKDGSDLSLGNLHLSFLETRMLHWPDNMFSYLAEDRLLFSQDAFGMHLASSERFADEIDPGILEYEGAKYFANILLPFSPLVTKLLEKVGQLGLQIDIIACDHGPIWRRDLDKILSWYATWAKQKPTMKALIVFDTMWHSTALMAESIAEGLVTGGANPKLLPLKANHRSDVATELLDAGALLVGSPTLNNNMFPTVADVLTYLKGLKPRNLVGTAFGSYGWSGEAVAQVRGILEAMKVELVGDGLRVKFVPDRETLGRCYDLGIAIADRLKAKAAKAD